MKSKKKKRKKRRRRWSEAIPTCPRRSNIQCHLQTDCNLHHATCMLRFLWQRTMLPYLSESLSFVTVTVRTGMPQVCSKFSCWFFSLYYPFRVRRLQQPQEQRYPVLQVHAGSFRVSVIHQSLTWTTGSLTCVHDHSYICVRIQTEIGHTDNESAQHFWLGKTVTNCSCAHDGARDLNLWSLDIEFDTLTTEPPRHPFKLKPASGKVRSAGVCMSSGLKLWEF